MCQVFDELKDLISEAINDIAFDDYSPDVELALEDGDIVFDEKECKKLFERLINVAVDAIQKEIE